MNKAILKYVMLFISLTSITFSNDFLNSNYLDLNSQFQQAQKKQGKTNQKFAYKDLIEYLKNSDDPNQIMILGVLYANGNPQKDDFGEKIEPDIIKAEKYLRLSAKKGNLKALAILGGLVLYNENMRKLDPNLKQTEIDLRKAYKNKILEAGVLLSTLLFEKNKWEEGLEILANSAKKGDSVAQLQLALIFKQGLKDGRIKGKNSSFIVKPNEELALFYLNQACSNEKKNEKVQKFCFNSKNIITERK